MLSLEPLLRARLGGIDGLRGVYGLAEPGAEKTRPMPCLYVAFGGYEVVENAQGGAVARIVVRWLVIVAAKNVARAADGQPVREDAQAIVGAVLRRLMGWQAAPEYSPLSLAGAPEPEYAAGTLFVPLAFDVEQIVKSTS